MSKSVGQRVEAIELECEGVWALNNITSWERNFIDSIRDLSKLSTKQMEILEQIEQKAGISED